MVVGLVGSIAAGAPPCPRYEVTAVIYGDEVCAFGELEDVEALAINNHGSIAGHVKCGLATDDKPYVWLGEDPILRLPLPAGTRNTHLHDMNDEGHAVGCLGIPGSGLSFQAYFFDGRETHVLGTFPDGNYSEATGINNGGMIVGYWGDNVSGDPPGRVFTWERGVMTDLGTFGGTFTRAHGVNEQGDIVGWRILRDGEPRIAFIRTDSELISLGVIPGGTRSEAYAVNDRREVVGQVHIDGTAHAFHWHDGAMTDLGTAEGKSVSAAIDINERGQMVGGSWSPGTIAVLWDDGVLYDLNELVDPPSEFQFEFAYGITDSGQIAADGRQGNLQVALLLTPILGDTDCDGIVGFGDLLRVLSGWGRCDARAKCAVDVDGDGDVGPSDVDLIFAHWGR